MRKKLLIGLLIAAAVIAALVSGCAHDDSDIQISFVPAGAAEPARTEIPLPSVVAFEEEVYEDIDNDGAEETITFYSTHSDDANEFLTVFEVSGGSDTYTESIVGCEYESSYILHTQSGKLCLLISLSDPLTYCSVIYSFDGKRPVEICGLGHITGVSGTDITQEGPIDALGTWHYVRTYMLNDDLSLAPGDYQIIMDDKEPLHAIKELPVELLTDGVYTKGYIDKGKDIIPVSTNGDSYFNFKLEDGSEGRIIFSRQAHDIYIDGKSEYEYFGNIEYTDMLY